MASSSDKRVSPPSEHFLQIWQRISGACTKSFKALKVFNLLRVSQVVQPSLLERSGAGMVADSPAVSTVKQDQLLDRSDLGLSRSIIDAISCTLVVLDGDGTILMVNHAWEQFGAENGASARLIAGTGISYFDVCNRSTASGITQVEGMQRVLRGEDPEFTCLYPCHSPTQKRWMKMQAVSLGQGCQALMLQHTNVSDAYLIKDVLQRMTQVVEQSPESVVIVGANGAIEYLNPGFTDLSGYPASDMVGCSYLAWRTAHLVCAAPEEMLVALVGRQPWSGDLFCRHRSGELYWEQVSLWPIQDYLDDGSKAGYVIISRNITEQKRAEKEILERKQALRELYASVLTVREEERRSVARDLHDDMGQALTALRMDVHQLKNSLVGADAAWPPRLSNMLTVVNQNIDVVRRVCENLRPGMLDILGLAAAIEHHVSQYARHSGLHCVLDMNREDFSTDEPTAITVFRIIQELLTNVSRHAQASEVNIVLHESAGSLRLQFSDNGIGISGSPSGERHRFGLLGIGERVSALSGSTQIDSPPSGGLCVSITLPLVISEASA